MNIQSTIIFFKADIRGCDANEMTSKRIYEF